MFQSKQNKTSSQISVEPTCFSLFFFFPFRVNFWLLFSGLVPLTSDWKANRNTGAATLGQIKVSVSQNPVFSSEINAWEGLQKAGRQVWLFPKKYSVFPHFIAQRLAEPELIVFDRLSFLWLGPVSFSVHVNF